MIGVLPEFDCSHSTPVSLMPGQSHCLDGEQRVVAEADLLNLTVSSEQPSKQRDSDLAEGKETLVTVHARTQGVDVDGLVDARVHLEAPTDSFVERGF